MSKSEKFKKLAKKRMDKLLLSIKLVANLSNRFYYDYTDDQKEQIIAAIDKEVKLLKRRFEANVSNTKKEEGFTFTDG